MIEQERGGGGGVREEKRKPVNKTREKSCAQAAEKSERALVHMRAKL